MMQHTETSQKEAGVEAHKQAQAHSLLIPRNSYVALQNKNPQIICVNMFGLSCEGAAWWEKKQGGEKQLWREEKVLDA